MTSSQRGQDIGIKYQLANGHQVRIYGSASVEQLESLGIEPGIRAFRPAEAQRRALVTIAKMPESMVTIAVFQGIIVGYITFHRPDEDSRWARAFTDGIVELGAIEVSPAWRHLGIGYQMMEAAFAHDFMEDYIVISTHYYWHWDLDGTGLSIWDYQKMLSKVMDKAGLYRTTTDEPDITAHPANMFQVRIGVRVPSDVKLKFELLRYRNKWFWLAERSDRMLVNKIMTQDVLTVQPSTTLREAMELIKNRQIRHLPVVDDQGVLVGMVSDRDLRAIDHICRELNQQLGNTSIKEVMSKSIQIAHPLDHIDDAARLLYEYKISALPVIQNEELVGIVTETDILRAFVELLGVNRAGTHLEVETADRPGMLAEITQIMGKHNINITSVYVASSENLGKKIIVLRLETIDPTMVIEELLKLGYKIVWPRNEF